MKVKIEYPTYVGYMYAVWNKHYKNIGSFRLHDLHEEQPVIQGYVYTGDLLDTSLYDFQCKYHIYGVLI